MSFKRAAEEISVTPSALSQRIVRLEQMLEMPLFERGNRRIGLTTAGITYQHEVRQALAALASVSSRAMQRAPTTLTLAMNSIVSHELVIPHLPLLQRWDPDLDICVRSRTSMKTFFAEDASDAGIDGGIRIGNGAWPQFESHLIGRLTAAPLCAPALLPQLRDWDDLHRHTLYCPRSRRAETLETFRHPATGAYPRQVVTFETLLEAARAVEAGMGVMSGMMPLMNGLVRRGRFTVAVGPVRPTAESLWLMVRADCRAPARMATVAEWLTDAFERLQAPVDAPAWLT
ncbi:transcriptional regulator GcvA [Hydrogenophaga electricum]|uniref:Transcriptional regulator GcvA n=2 Tax=Comamonadaceae TaxID=80864 RepID=A0ABQ6BY72_9BURK|nr:transcriptional regulator GcvA [Hydrogenophaga electricum]